MQKKITLNFDGMTMSEIPKFQILPEALPKCAWFLLQNSWKSLLTEPLVWKMRLWTVL